MELEILVYMVAPVQKSDLGFRIGTGSGTNKTGSE